MVQKTTTVSRRGMSVLPLICIFALNINTLMAARVETKSFQHKKFFGGRRHIRRYFTEATPFFIKKEEEATIVPESPLLANDDSNSALDLAEKRLVQYLSLQQRKEGIGKFHLHGWRWHNMSLIRETERLLKLAQQCSQTSSSSSLDDNHIANLKKAIDYVVNFNLKGMIRVENEVLIPFLRQQFEEHNDVKQSMETIIDHLEIEQQNLSKLGLQLSSKLSESNALGSSVADDIMQKSNEIIAVAKSMLERKNNIIIPVMTQLVPERKQKTTTSKIISTLGLLDARLHLVGFHEAIKNDEKEVSLWNENIPLVARKAIPMWKQSQYDPQTSSLLEI